MEIDALLSILSQKNGSDLFLSTGAAPSARIDGVLTALSDQPFKPGETAAIATSLMDAEQRREFDRDLEMNLAISRAGVGRFRVNIFKQRNDVSIVIRNVKVDIPRFEDLKLPPVLLETVMLKRGLILFVGATSSGKSTSLAALIDHRNRHSAGHIVTIEDPIEYIHRHKRSIINQREVGVDTRSFHAALKNTLRQAPDVVLIGEIRDRETMEHALSFADTGHLVLSTLHATNANQALDRIINMFPEEKREQLLQTLGNNLKACVSQRLVRTVDGQRRAAVEILLGTPTIADLVRRGQFEELKPIMEKSTELGMQTFDAALFALVAEGAINEQEALKNADSVNNLKLRIKLQHDQAGVKDTGAGEWGLMD
ncbi:PilT/PilU family type 4a pilus ATPase [Pseudomonas moraviensis subsp. stanleyae]|uniref:PilT/PilU family type 4a pilus ATPase n=1 Tax=Pseudomonas moraviensis TaxID=321662 RepID=UPI002E2F8CE2|nr:PilT/PilU family type 4a pilus ATPase [Pseudomonas moraviensis]MED7666181.1 PilT/PilU family type 4a pilus ATPase [Pseudomonas moraviensis subsp. stanleyae]